MEGLPGVGIISHARTARIPEEAPITDTARDDRSSAASELCRAASELHGRGWCLGTSGNFSVRLRKDPIELLITRSGCDKRRLTAEDLVLVGLDGKPLAGEKAVPSAEALLHATVATLARAGAVLHTHAVWSTLLGQHYRDAGGLTLTGYEMLKGLEGIDSHLAEVFVPIVKNSQDMHELAGWVKELMAEWPSTHGFLVAGHGLYTWGTTLAQAQRHVEIFEFLFECVGRRTHFASDAPARGGSGAWPG